MLANDRLRAVGDLVAALLVSASRARRGQVSAPDNITYCLALDGVYRKNGEEVRFQEARAPSGDELEQSISRLIKMLIREGYLIEQQEITHLADIDADNPLKSLQAASGTYCVRTQGRKS